MNILKIIIKIKSIQKTIQTIIQILENKVANQTNIKKKLTFHFNRKDLISSPFNHQNNSYFNKEKNVKIKTKFLNKKI